MSFCSNLRSLQAGESLRNFPSFFVYKRAYITYRISTKRCFFTVLYCFKFLLLFFTVSPFFARFCMHFVWFYTFMLILFVILARLYNLRTFDCSRKGFFQVLPSIIQQFQEALFHKPVLSCARKKKTKKAPQLEKWSARKEVAGIRTISNHTYSIYQYINKPIVYTNIFIKSVV